MSSGKYLMHIHDEKLHFNNYADKKVTPNKSIMIRVVLQVNESHTQTLDMQRFDKNKCKTKIQQHIRQNSKKK